MLAEFFNVWESPEFQTLDSCVPCKPGLEVPPPPRLQCGLCGINNQGATCYLNSLLQTLLYTPELRESLFCLGEEDLGCLKDAKKSKTKVRIIPIQLQRLFARLLLSNQQSVKTVELTESFGWTNHEELQQHDVQELNRILFSAIEDSLVGTSGTQLIQKLYHGTTVNQITCSECNKVSEKEEDFLDLTLAVAGHCGLEDGLKSCFCDIEVMEGKNQYRCESCNKHVNATKGAKIRCLPQILTISLLRFSFNFQKLERYKETGKYTFPSTINMAPFYEKSNSDKDTEYELFSVVIHRGSAYGGHYFAYIRDVDNLGKWVSPEEEEIQIAPDASKGDVDYIDCDSPVDVLRILLDRHPEKTMPVDKLCTELKNEIGLSWNKRYKKHYGPINKFFSKYNDTFTLEPKTNTVALKQTCSQHKETTEEKQTETPGKDDVNNAESEWGYSTQAPGCIKKKKNKNQSSKSVVPPEGHRWFKFDDSHVNSIHAKEIEKQFSGKESAYMLFYRKKSQVGSAQVNNPYYGIPEDLVNDVLEENKVLDRKRQEYETKVNSLTLQIHFGCNYELRHGALQPLPDSCTWMELSIDRRKEMSVLLQKITDLGGEMVPEDFVVHRMNQTAAGGHLYDLVSSDCDKQLHQLGITDNTQLFVWNGKEVQKIPLLTGAFNEPIFLTVIYGDQSQINWGFNKSMLLEKLKGIICDDSDIHQNFLQLKRLVGKDSELKAVILEGDQRSLEELGLKDGDQLVAENMTLKRSNVEQATIAASNKFLLQVENHCIQTDAEYPKSKVEADREVSIADLKKLCLRRFGLKCAETETRMRIEHDTLGFCPPLHEDQCVFDAGIGPGTCLALEYGLAPATDQITLTFTPGEPTSNHPDMEIIVNRNMLVSHCLELMKEKADLPEGHWHLRKTNWCREAAEVLDDLDCTLEDAHVDDGSHLLLEKGKIPAKGNLNLQIWLYPTLENAASKEDGSRAGLLSWITTAMQNILMRYSEENKAPSRSPPVQIGEIEISKTATLDDFKLHVMTLLIATELMVPSPDFMRLRLVEHGKPARVLRDINQTLQRMKINSGSIIALQLLPEEENLRPSDLVIRIRKRIPDTLDYEPDLELIWDTSQGASAENLREAVAHALCIPVESLCIAKHLPHKFEWLMIEDDLPNSQGKKKGKKKGKPFKASLCQSPYNIKDGDVIGAKDLSFDPLNKDTFVTIQDLDGKEQLQMEAEIKRKEREEKKSLQGEFCEEKKKRQPEVNLSIKVEDFS
ncbi:hypothetical protein CHS0354_004734 [Potamilus streckersoni]|uniref:USP domain-containing protein n=1 Tax=Potamilus streckersoni TaxID=2493646 RepID=A0AAE0VTD2_9BIVA|nr:hypothetical protein CHS0354_004734 [Potamilus streckersoni]